jgi:hypothetical protein
MALLVDVLSDVVLGERIERNLYDLSETVIRANYTRQRRELLEQANLTLAILRLQMRLDARSEGNMQPSQTKDELRERFLRAMLEASFPLQQGPDPEVTLEALIEAAAMLQQRFEQELEELREESD